MRYRRAQTDLFKPRPVYRLVTGQICARVLLRDGYPVAQGDDATVRLHPCYERAIR